MGCALLLAYGAIKWHFGESSRADIRAFAEAKRDHARTTRAASRVGPNDQLGTSVTESTLPLSEQTQLGHDSLSILPEQPDTTKWSAHRKAAYDASSPALAEGILRIESLDLVVPVYRGTSEHNLNRGIAWIESTAPLGTLGNVGLAAHRDGYFRTLGDIEMGDRITLETLRGSWEYIVDRTMIVKPTEVEVLAPSSAGKLTLVTCYPFYFVGPAPQRFIVHARLATEQPTFKLTARSPTSTSAPELAP